MIAVTIKATQKVVNYHSFSIRFVTMGGQSHEAQGPSTLGFIFRILIATIASIIFSVIFIVTYVSLSEHHKEETKVFYSLFRISDTLLERHHATNIIWVLDATVAFICLFLIIEDAFLLYELNCELHALNSAAHLSLREALEIDNRYLKDAIVLEAKESQEETTAIKPNKPQVHDDEVRRLQVDGLKMRINQVY